MVQASDSVEYDLDLFLDPEGYRPHGSLRTGKDVTLKAGMPAKRVTRSVPRLGRTIHDVSHDAHFFIALRFISRASPSCRSVVPLRTSKVVRRFTKHSLVHSTVIHGGMSQAFPATVSR